MPISKPFIAAVEGVACDGRPIERIWITQMAKNFNRQVRGARVNLEHIKGYSPTSDFRAYGDVVSANEVTVPDGPLKGKAALELVIDATPDLVALSKQRQKIYPSVEVHPSLPNTGEAYLMGLAMTDDPASLGVGILEFNAGCKGKGPLDSRKSTPECLFTATTDDVGVVLEFEEDVPAGESGASFFSRIKELLTGNQQKFSQENGEIRQAIEAVAESQRGVLDSISQFSAIKQENTTLKQQIGELSQSVTALKAALEQQDGDFSRRPPTTGNSSQSDAVLADC
ncbi:GPO family capsid scaffolding protein [Dickeya solani]|uniref:GPO family capsid scaffolding protein n=1 Tax=Dickeya solani TaxID=1089444 RepID=A0ABU4EEA2_9GAMM|nr:GPO family capsid scaffolding protein [Dickeya solani]MCA7001655.1 GPO family capsid scaffolding protein [Dickeya solani]MCZ0821059.1 GPO family capsid scaffolding protein [Dickeya solani]MDV6997434.1 GPO family capsid scaffolding protein [Dickeya solani]MDV7003068.1 GPO family capsid scaffolding protein [Dickeya solani]MDV7040240.1 GPO family capsid scaffolding protein [Dickeya solani]